MASSNPAGDECLGQYTSTHVRDVFERMNDEMNKSLDFFNSDVMKAYKLPCRKALDSMKRKFILVQSVLPINQIICYNIGPFDSSGNSPAFHQFSLMKQLLPLFGLPKVHLFYKNLSTSTRAYFEDENIHIIDTEKECLKKLEDRTLFYVPNEDNNFIEKLICSKSGTGQLQWVLILGLPLNPEYIENESEGDIPKICKYPSIEKALPHSFGFPIKPRDPGPFRSVEGIYGFNIDSV